MHLTKLELRLSKVSLIIWTAALSSVLALCVLIYPILEGSMEQMGEMFSDFSLDLSEMYGDFMKYFASEFSAEFGLGAALFAAIMGARLLSKEQANKTAEFLLTHPVSRRRVVTEKLIAFAIMLMIFNLGAFVIVLGCILLMGVEFSLTKLCLMFLVYLMLQVQIGSISFGLSSVLNRGGVGVGLGLAVGTYFLQLIASITEETEFLMLFTPFGYADGITLVNEGTIDLPCLLVGMALSVGGILLAYWHYPKKDIQ